MAHAPIEVQLASFRRAWCILLVRAAALQAPEKFRRCAPTLDPPLAWRGFSSSLTASVLVAACSSLRTSSCL